MANPPSRPDTCSSAQVQEEHNAGTWCLRRFTAEEHRGERWQGETERVWPAVRRVGAGPDAAVVAHAAAAIFGGVAVEHFFPEAAPGDADTVVLTRHRGEVARDQHGCARCLAATQEDEHALIGIVRHNPTKAG